MRTSRSTVVLRSFPLIRIQSIHFAFRFYFALHTHSTHQHLHQPCLNTLYCQIHPQQWLMSSKTATILQAPTTVPIRSSLETCQQCGADVSHSHLSITEDAQRRIAELETQVKILTDKATAAGESKFPSKKRSANRGSKLLRR